MSITVNSLRVSKPAAFTPQHHVGSPPSSFRNPWPSEGSQKRTLIEIVRKRFFDSKSKNYVPVPEDRKGLPRILHPDWGFGDAQSRDLMRVTWIGHASFLVEMPSADANQINAGGRGIRILLDPVFSSNMSPFSFGGPKRISIPPCSLEELPDVDLVLISHDHYDHLDATTIKFVNARGKGRLRYLCGLGVKTHIVAMGVEADHVIELDWWEGRTISVGDIGNVNLICTPSQHISGRWWNDHGKSLWCSWIVEEARPPLEQASSKPSATKRLFFAGDTGYRFKPKGTDPAEYEKLPACPAFKQIGEQYGPFDLALLPIGCYAPRDFMSHVHSAPEDSICIHQDIKSKKSLGMHYGTVRGNVSEHFEDATEPARLWKEECEKRGLLWSKDIGLCDIGETVIV